MSFRNCEEKRLKGLEVILTLVLFVFIQSMIPISLSQANELNPIYNDIKTQYPEYINNLLSQGQYKNGVFQYYTNEATINSFLNDMELELAVVELTESNFKTAMTNVIMKLFISPTYGSKYDNLFKAIYSAYPDEMDAFFDNGDTAALEVTFRPIYAIVKERLLGTAVITINSEAKTYLPGRIVNISGTLSVNNTVKAGRTVSVKVYDPDNQVTSLGSMITAGNGSFSISYNLAPGAKVGIYTIQAIYSKTTANSTFQVATTAAAPITDLVPGTYDQTQTLSLTTSTNLAKIYYTVDGSTPSEQSTLYGDSITIEMGNTTVKAVAVLLADGGKLFSDVTTLTYLVEVPGISVQFGASIYRTGKTVNISGTLLINGVGSTGRMVSVQVKNPDNQATSLGNLTTGAGGAISSTYNLDQNAGEGVYTIEATYGSTKATSTFQAYTVAAPKADLGSGTYDTTKMVALSTDTAGQVKIFYTTNGNDPTEQSMEYTDQDRVNIGQGSTTVMAITVLDVGGVKLTSDVTTLTYLVEVPEVTVGSNVAAFTPGQIASISGSLKINGNLEDGRQVSVKIFNANNAVAKDLGNLVTANGGTYSGTWDLTGVTAGTYTIKAQYASTSPVATTTFDIVILTLSIIFNSPKTITFTSSVGSTVYYTTDGSNPADLQNAGRHQYITPININTEGQITLKAVAMQEVKGVTLSSATVSETYNIQLGGSISGFVRFEKRQLSDPEPDHSNIQVIVKQGDTVIRTTLTSQDGSYILDWLPEGNYDVVYLADGWSKVTRTGNTVAIEQDTVLTDLTLLLGDVNADSYINANDLLWIATKLGKRPESPGWDAKADVDLNTYVNVNDLLRVSVNIGKRPL